MSNSGAVSRDAAESESVSMLELELGLGSKLARVMESESELGSALGPVSVSVLAIGQV
jgi:hypothetical protein